MAMDSELRPVEPPAWMLRLFASIDALDVSAQSGFQVFDADVVMQFGPETLKGIEAVTEFFTKLDSPFLTEHLVDRVFQFDRAFLMQGRATLRKKADPEAKTLRVAPLFNLFWLNDSGRVIRYVVEFPPDVAASPS
jgi:hypothetical protein